MKSKSDTQVPRLKKRKKRSPPGAVAGSLVVDPQAPKPVLHMTIYDRETLEERLVTDLETLRETCQDPNRVYWVRVEGLGDETVIRSLRDIFNLHPLAVEDVVNVHQRAKVEDYGSHLFVVTRVASGYEQITTDQLSLFLGRNYVLTFQERETTLLDPLRERLKNKLGLLRTRSADFLAYTILDIVTDYYFPILEDFGERLEDLEVRIIKGEGKSPVPDIHAAKQDLLVLRRVLWPMRDVFNHLMRDEFDLFRPETEVYLRDCYDHTAQLIDLVEIYRELSSDLMDIHLSNTSNKMNEVMKVLTVISSIFIPLSFVAGVYGMNFDTSASPYNMPELHWPYGYPAVLALMLLMAIGLLTFFRIRGWIGK